MLALALLLCAAGPSEADLRAAVKKSLAYWRSPGVAVAIVKDGKVVFLEGHGVRRVGGADAVTPDTLFAFGSNSKAFTTAAMAMLAEEGKLKWDDKVGKYLDWFRIADEAADREVTLRDLVSHRTGLAGHDLLWYRSPDTPAEMVRKAGLLPPEKPFRKSFQYQSVMFTAAGLAAAHAAGTTWDDLIRKRLLDPLGMKSTFPDSESASRYKDVAEPHSPDPADRIQPRPRYRWSAPNAAGSISGTARDLAAWMRFQLTGLAPDGKRLIPLKALQETHAPQIDLEMLEAEKPLFAGTKHRGYAMGWVKYDHRGETLVAHGGALDGHRCHITLAPDRKIGVAVLANLNQTPLAPALAGRLMEMMLGLDPPRDWDELFTVSLEKGREIEARRVASEPKPRGGKPSLSPMSFKGTYTHPAYGRVTVKYQKAGGDLLEWTWREWSSDLEHWQDDTYRLPATPAGDARVTFQTKDGRVTGMHVTGRLNVTFRRDD